MIDFSLVKSVTDTGGSITIFQADGEQQFPNGIVNKVMLVRMPLRYIGGKVTNTLVPAINFVLTPVLLLLKKGKVPYPEHHGLILQISHDEGKVVEYWTAQKYQCGDKGPIRVHKMPSIIEAIVNIKDCGCNPTASHLIEYYEPKTTNLCSMWEYMRNYDQTYSYIKPQHCQTFASSFLSSFCTKLPN